MFLNEVGQPRAMSSSTFSTGLVLLGLAGAVSTSVDSFILTTRKFDRLSLLRKLLQNLSTPSHSPSHCISGCELHNILVLGNVIARCDTSMPLACSLDLVGKESAKTNCLVLATCQRPKPIAGRGQIQTYQVGTYQADVHIYPGRGVIPQCKDPLTFSSGNIAASL